MSVTTTALSAYERTTSTFDRVSDVAGEHAESVMVLVVLLLGVQSLVEWGPLPGWSGSFGLVMGLAVLSTLVVNFGPRWTARALFELLGVCMAIVLLAGILGASTDLIAASESGSPVAMISLYFVYGSLFAAVMMGVFTVIFLISDGLDRAARVIR